NRILLAQILNLAGMNFLAHIYLSGKDEELILGNFIDDSLKGRSYLKYPLGIQRGVVLHRSIDFYTDTHPTVRKSISRLFGTYGHYSGIIVDIVYDHFLAARWKEYSPVPLDIFVSEFYELLQRNYTVLPTPIQQFLPYMIKDNWLLSYASLEGIGRILYQMNERTKRKSKMNFAIVELEEHYVDFESEFVMFVEELQIFVSSKIEEI